MPDLSLQLQPQIEADNPTSIICGIDEAGRGPLCGDVYAAAVVFERGTLIEGLRDSKKLTEKKREAEAIKRTKRTKKAKMSAL